MEKLVDFLLGLFIFTMVSCLAILVIAMTVIVVREVL